MTPDNDNPPRPLMTQQEWDRIAASEEFKRLIAAKKSFIVPAFLFFCGYNFMLPILVAIAPRMMATPILGAVTIGWLFALSQFVVGGIVAWLYMRAAARFDALTKNVLHRAAAIEREDTK